MTKGDDTQRIVRTDGQRTTRVRRDSTEIRCDKSGSIKATT